MRGFIEGVYRGLRWLLTLLMGLLMIPIVLQIVSRFSPDIPHFIWTEEIAQFGYAQSSELTGLNMLTVHIAWPLAGAVFALFLGEKIADDLALMRQHRHGRG